MEREFTAEELAECTGEGGKPVCVAVGGKVYDVSGSKMWKTGKHMKRHPAGRDLSADMAAAPHGKEVLERESVKWVGRLVHEEEKEPLPDFLVELFKRFPILRRHPHPMMVHFPMAYLMGAALFLILDAFWPRSPVLEQIGFALLVLAAFFTPPAILTGLLTWWVNYGAKRVHQVTRKLQLAVVVALVEIVCLILRARGPIESEPLQAAYFALTLLLGVCTVGLGWYGGQLTFPYEKE
jgi:predicted heme/steroid binding protein/uncharacterized membrane protein